MLVFAHRGASADAPENTLLAMRTAVAQQADGIEFDVQQIGNELVVFHDRVLSRTTNGSGLLQDQSIQELHRLDAGQEQTIPTLWQVLELIDGQCLVNIEVKGHVEPQLLVSYIHRAKTELNFRLDQFIVSSFNHHFLLEFSALEPNIKIGALTASKPLTYAAFAEKLKAYSVNIDMSVLDQKYIADAKNRGLKVMVYTVDNARELIQLKEWGVDAVFCNGPRKALITLNQM
ncbi:glycerophosphodiester phosphodiesterase [Paraglaciecola aquimarina]|uniref:Glycerophosphodiester phosphodiesterase n=1 Tax=Paraglaciecola algarum TaxID=3050085 RepID=A0ABS9D6P0_9ALTE|nr:glycerophosphodiester phosphodiesterase family protein [Paraglaciecola sp. G1-23]MCF2948092.1 glycerophosphodiester phosphodiesterase [Paraglaciecola sp. G1-23]